MTTSRTRTLLCLVAGFLIPLLASAQTVPRMARSMMVLKEEAKLQRAGKALEPDLAKHGGVEIYRAGRSRVVELPPEALETLRTEPSLRYLVRIYTGHPEDRHEYVAGPPDDVLRIAPESSDPQLSWTTGDYVYDGAGNIAQIDTDRYAYDEAQRLVEATIKGTTVRYAYDAFGNRLSTTYGSGTPVATPVEPATNRLQGAQYDIAGNQVLAINDTERYTFDAVNMMTERAYLAAGGDRYIYTADYERIGSIRGSETKWVIRDLDGKPLGRFHSDTVGVPINPDWDLRDDYYYLNGRLVASLRRDGDYEPATERRYHSDHLGTPRLVTNGQSVQVALHTYYPSASSRPR